MKKAKTSRKLWIVFACVVLAAALLAVAVFAADDNRKEDAMSDIREAFAAYQKGDVQKVGNDGYIGIPVEVSVYADDETVIKNGYDLDATPVVVYVVNTQMPRVGTASDVQVIASMLKRGYIVTVFDYLGNEKAVSPDLDWSIQTLRAKVTSGGFFSGLDGFPTGRYANNLVVPAGYDAVFNLVYWEMDKHGVEGTLERIVDVWNNDFRGVHGEVVIPWANGDGSRKATQNAADGSSPVWLDASGNTDADGRYIKIKYTKAEEITDCVKPDGSPIDLSLYMHIVYPVAPEKDVPVMTLASSSEHLASGTQTADRPQFVGYPLNGYAAAAFDYAYVPMARNDHYGYFDGSTPASGSVTGDNVTYSVHWFNENEVNTAAMRYLRYLSETDHATYAFDENAIGVYGNSKGGWATSLGEEHPELLEDRRYMPGADGKTRYEAGKTESYTKNGATVDGGEAQPWLSANGKTLDCGADFIYSGCGGGAEQVTPAHCPMFISCNTADGSYYSTNNRFVLAARSMDIPAFWVEIDKGHTLVSGPDRNHGFDTYQALFDVSGYYLKGDAAKVAYIEREASYGGMPTDAPIHVQFTGAVDAEQIAKITLKDEGGSTVGGKWTSSFGGLFWTLETPTLAGEASYTLTVPADLEGRNGKALGKASTYRFETGVESASAAQSKQTEKGLYVWFDKPVSPESFTPDLWSIRLNVTGDAANSLTVYPLSGFDPEDPDGASAGAALGTVRLSGAGYYDFDVTAAVKDLAAGSRAAFLVKTDKTAGETVVFSSPLDTANTGFSLSSTAAEYSFTKAPDGTPALAFTAPKLVEVYQKETFYQNPQAIMTTGGIIAARKLTAEDTGRRFLISMRVYDTVSRILNVRMNTCTSSSTGTVDYDGSFYNFYTKAGEWTEFSFVYTVYEEKYAESRGWIQQSLSIIAAFPGEGETPIYFRDVTSTEIVTGVEYAEGAAELLVGTTAQKVNPLETPYGTIPELYADAEKYPFVVFDTKGVFVTASDHFAADGGSGALGYLQNSSNSMSAPLVNDIILLRRDFVSTHNYNNLSFVYGDVTIDLDGHTFTSENHLFLSTAKRSLPTRITVKNGTILQKDQPLISYQGNASTNYVPSVNGAKLFAYTFENVTFGYAEGAKAYPIVRNEATVSAAVRGSVQFTDCIFDLTNRPSGSYTLLSAIEDSQGNAGTALTVSGGRLIAEDLSGITVGGATGNCSLTFEKKGGDYMTVSLPAGANAPVGQYATTSGARAYEKTSEEGGRAIFTLQPLPDGPDPLETKYGRIPDAYADEEAYPFVLFRKNGDSYSFVMAEADIFVDNSKIMIQTRTVDGCVILMRRNFSTENRFSNMAFCKENSEVVFDLGGHTLDLSKIYLHVMFKGKAWNKILTYRDGTVVSGSNPFMIFVVNAASGETGYTVNFENITFARAANATAPYPFFRFDNAGNKGFVDLNLTDCTFDLTGASIPTAGLTVIHGGSKDGNLTSRVTVRGSKVVASTLENVTLAAANNENSSLIFEKSGDEYLTLVLPATAAAPAITLPTADGELPFAKVSSEDGKTTYTLKAKEVGPDTQDTPYGRIPDEYADEEAYPFVLFEKSGDSYSFVMADANIFVDNSPLMIKLRSIGGAVYLRRDFENSSLFNNLAWCKADTEIVFDLGGHTITMIGDVRVQANMHRAWDCVLVYKNGTMIGGNNPFFIFTKTQENGAGHGARITFENITFARPATSFNRIPVYRIDNSNFKGFVDLTFDGCTFDLTGTTPDAGLTVFSAGSANGNITSTVTVKDCAFLTPTTEKLILTNIGNTASKVLFSGENRLTASSALAAPEGEYLSDGEKTLVWLAGETADGKTVYTLGELVWGEWKQTVAPTCTEAGSESRIATGGMVETREVKPLGHDLVHHDGKDATCTEPGYKPYDTCTRCDYSTYETIPAKGHTYGEWIEEIPATYESEGVLGHYHCSVCEKNFDAEKKEIASLVIPKLEAGGEDIETASWGKKFAKADQYVTPVFSEIHTIEAWVKFDQDSTSRGSIFSNYIDANHACVSFEVQASGVPRVYLINGTPKVQNVVFSNVNLFTGEWTYLAVVLDTANKNARLYVNGELAQQANMTLTGVCVTENPYVIGGDLRSGNFAYCRGLIHSVAVSASVLTEEQILADMTAPDTGRLLGLWYPDEEGTLRLKDYSGNKNHLTYNDTETYEDTAEDEKASWGKAFAKADQYVTPVLPEIHTIEAWVKFDQGSTSRGSIFSNYIDTEHASVSFEVQTSGIPRVYLINGTPRAQNVGFSDVNLFTGEWTYLAVVLDTANKTARLYVNGELAQEVNMTLTGVCVTENPYVIGGDLRSGNFAYCRGLIHSVAVSASVLTEEQILADMTAPDAGRLLGLWYPDEEGELRLKDYSGNKNHLTYNDTETYKDEEEIPTVQGLSFTDDPLLKTETPYPVVPKTIEATIMLPAGYDAGARPGVIIGNYQNGSTVAWNLELFSSCVPRFYYVFADGTSPLDVRFPQATIVAGRPVHLSIVIEESEIVCYVDGVEKQRVTLSTPLPYVPKNAMVIGGDYRSKNAQYFKGAISRVVLFTEARTAEQIAADAAATALPENALCAYELSAEQTDVVRIEDAMGHYPLIRRLTWIPSVDIPKDYAYSIAVVGDTQILTERDPAALQGIYDFILDHAQSDKIGYVLGLGDITQNNLPEEWERAAAQIRRMDGKLLYSLVRGGMPHDGPAYFNEYLNTEYYRSTVDGFYDPAKIENTYRFVRLGSTDYLIFTLDFGPSAAVLEWAGDVIAKNPDKRVIITTHAYLYRDGTPMSPGDVAVPANNGDFMWENLISQYPNIEMVLCGHDPNSNIILNRSYGVHGNLVTSMLINPQGMDASESTGMVAMFYFSEDGETLDVRYYSTAKKAYYQEQNQFRLTLDHTYGAWIPEIPATYEEEGVIAHYTCPSCGKHFDAEYKEITDLSIPKAEKPAVMIEGVKQNITLTTELRTNVFFPQGEKRVTKVLYGGVELPLLQRTLDGVVYDYVTVSVAAKDAAKEIALTVSFTYEGESYEQTIKANLPQYASLLAKHEEGKYASLANAILYYVKCADSSAAFEAVREEAQKAAAVNSIDASSPIKGASIYLGSSPVWVISLDTGYTGKIRYRFAGRTYQKEVAKQESLALDEIRLSDLTETISFSYTNADGAFVEAGSYNLSAYAEAVSENASVSALVDALYDYSVAAHQYIYGE